jgi:hypothetical protein
VAEEISDHGNELKQNCSTGKNKQLVIKTFLIIQTDNIKIGSRAEDNIFCNLYF